MTMEHNLGGLIIHIAQQMPNAFISFGTVNSLFGSDFFTLKFTGIKNGKSYSITEMLSAQQLVDISDPKVIGDAIIAKLRNEMTK